MPAPDPLITKKQLENRLGRDVVQSIYDDNNDGVADVDPINQLLADASDYVRGGLPAYNPDDLTQANAAITGELRRLSLDMAVAMAAQRHSGYVRYDWEKLMVRVDSGLELVRKSQRSLGSNSNPTPADATVSVFSAPPRDPDSFWP